jgi:hypothetical protein
MNCSKCGAPVKIIEGKEYYHCDYCGNFDVPNPNEDGVALRNEKSQYYCPSAIHNL